MCFLSQRSTILYQFSLRKWASTSYILKERGTSTRLVQSTCMFKPHSSIGWTVCYTVKRVSLWYLWKWLSVKAIKFVPICRASGVANTYKTNRQANTLFHLPVIVSKCKYLFGNCGGGGGQNSFFYFTSLILHTDSLPACNKRLHKCVWLVASSNKNPLLWFESNANKSLDLAWKRFGIDVVLVHLEFLITYIHIWWCCHQPHLQFCFDW